jgi:hypothetical protein
MMVDEKSAPMPNRNMLALENETAVFITYQHHQ